MNKFAEHNWIRKYHKTMDARSKEIMRDKLYADKAFLLYLTSLDIDVADDLIEIHRLLPLVGGNPMHKVKDYRPEPTGSA